MERLDKFLCDAGAGTRSQVKQILKTGRVTVDGRPVKDGSVKIDPALSAVALDGQTLSGKRRMVVMFNKPAGFVTATQDKQDRTVMELLKPEWRNQDLKPVGRLDKATEGLLLFTNDGEFSQRLMHPKWETDKTYLVWVTGYAPGAEARLARAISLDGRTIRPPKVRLLQAEGERAKFSVTIHEGRNRQVRRMCQAAGMHCVRLRRITEGSMKLGDLAPGKWRYLTAQEVDRLKRESAMD